LKSGKILILQIIHKEKVTTKILTKQIRGLPRALMKLVKPTEDKSTRSGKICPS